MEDNLLDNDPINENKPVNKTGKIIGINLIVLLLLGTGCFFADEGGQHAGMGFGILMIMLIIAQGIINIILAIIFFIKNNRQRGLAHLLSVLVVLLVGSSGCFGGLALM